MTLKATAETKERILREEQLRKYKYTVSQGEKQELNLENGEFKLTEKFLGTIDYTGKLEGNQLTLFNGEPTNPLTCMYVFEKG